ncbi:MBL fold metallo-hydrolase [Parvularcula sp. ZS-1/3]|uniref:MBL fold metallo-hydrolase n=1 Tax=Parvularcula mediterranea TaxID=2732508 RepID=A0A7Y3RJH7_9PROT|nr:MBL fold metallo-hydrolase [Parvularcula mediterranea]NNU14805.1 MBL fold metallo-hydrolase [Parvularcula mediterranea]
MANPDVQAFFDEVTNTISYIVSDPATKKAAIIDPVLDFDLAAARTSTESASEMLGVVAEQGLTVDWILETHAHADHLTSAKVLAEKTGAKIGIGTDITEVQTKFAPLFGVESEEAAADVFDKLFVDGETFQIGSLDVRVLHTPGHTPACISYQIGDAIFVGDTLFMPDFGTARSDFPGGDARTLYRSIQKILSLAEETRVFVGHDYLPKGRETYQWETTVGEQKRSNIHVGAGKTEEQFVSMRETRDKTLGAPKLILPSLQVNIRGGSMPEADDDGTVYLRLPINKMG